MSSWKWSSFFLAALTIFSLLNSWVPLQANQNIFFINLLVCFIYPSSFGRISIGTRSSQTHGISSHPECYNIFIHSFTGCRYYLYCISIHLCILCQERLDNLHQYLEQLWIVDIVKSPDPKRKGAREERGSQANLVHTKMSEILSSIKCVQKSMSYLLNLTWVRPNPAQLRITVKPATWVFTS